MKLDFFVLLFHIFCFSIYVFAEYYNLRIIERPLNSKDYEMLHNIGGPFKFLTFLDVVRKTVEIRFL